MSKQRIAVKLDGNLRRLTVSEFDVAPSWKRFGAGWVTAEFSMHDVAGWCTVWVTEHSEEEGRRSVSRAATVTLDREAATELHKQLSQMLGVAP